MIQISRLRKKSRILLAFGTEEIVMLLSKNRLANEMRLVQGGKFELLKDMKISRWMFKFSIRQSCTILAVHILIPYVTIMWRNDELS